MFHGTTQFDLHLFKLSDLFLLLKLESKVTISQGPKVTEANHELHGQSFLSLFDSSGEILVLWPFAQSEQLS